MARSEGNVQENHVNPALEHVGRNVGCRTSDNFVHNCNLALIVLAWLGDGPIARIANGRTVTAVQRYGEQSQKFYPPMEIQSVGSRRPNDDLKPRLEEAVVGMSKAAFGGKFPHALPLKVLVNVQIARRQLDCNATLPLDGLNLELAR